MSQFFQTAGGALGDPVSLAHGGTNASLVADNGGVVYSTATALAIVPHTATANQPLLSGASGAPGWSTATYPGSTTINQILYSSAANTIVGLASANNGVLTTGGTGVPSIDVTNFQVLTTGVQMKGNNANTAPPAGFIGQQIRATVAVGTPVVLVTGTAKTVTSIDLTAGIWDVSCVCSFITGGVATLCNASISIVDNTNGTAGDNMVESSAVPVNAVTNSSVIVPAYRITLAATTTVYMVGQMAFSVSGSAYGRISATRVG